MSAWPPELPWLWAGAAAYGLAAVQAWLPWWRTVSAGDAVRRDARQPAEAAGVPLPLALGLLCLAIGIGVRWVRLGHGPFLNMFEILASSLFSLGLIYAVALRRQLLPPAIGPGVPTLLAVMAVWMTTTDAGDTHFPPTYDTPVLWFHVLLGKIFLGCAMLAFGLAGWVLVRASAWGARWRSHGPGDDELDARAWQLMRVALVFESLMLIAGAVWAQDAWGRWWAWDPLETWAFLTWLLLAGALHARQSWRIGPRGGAWLVVAVFALAFVTFFGVPFVSVAPHKGAV